MSNKSTIVSNWWTRKFKREPEEAVIVDTFKFTNATIQKVMVRAEHKLTCVLVMHGGGKAQRIFIEQDN